MCWKKLGTRSSAWLITPHPLRTIALTASPTVRSRIVRMLLRGVVDHVAHAEFVEHARDQAEVVQHLATVWGLSGPNNRL